MIREKLNKIRTRRAKRIRSKIVGNKDKPRLSVFRSNQYMYAQVIDDLTQKTIVSASTRGVKKESKGKVGEVEVLGKLLAERVKEAGIKEMVLDRGRYAYHGRVKALTDVLRENGIKL